MVLLIIFIIIIALRIFMLLFDMPFGFKEKTPASTIQNITLSAPHVVSDIQENLESKLQLEEWVNSKMDYLRKQISLKQLIREKTNADISYKDLLECGEWQLLRLKILFRDKYTCQDCKLINSTLDIHHLYYLKAKLPWDIDEDALVALCSNCHSKRHGIEKISVFEKVGSSLILSDNQDIYCSRCAGIGYLPEYNHVCGGICFRCQGGGRDKTLFSDGIEHVINNPLAYDDNTVFISAKEFFSRITIDKFKTHVTDKYKPSLWYIHARDATV